MVLGGRALPPEPLGHPTDTTEAWRRIPVVFADEVLDALPDGCVPVAVEWVVEATPLPEFEHPESAAYVFGPENGSLDEMLLERCAQVVCIPGHQSLGAAGRVASGLHTEGGTPERGGRGPPRNRSGVAATLRHHVNLAAAVGLD